MLASTFSFKVRYNLYIENYCGIYTFVLIKGFLGFLEMKFCPLLCRQRSIAARRDHFVRRLSVCVCVCLSDSHTFLIVTHSYVSQATHAFLGMLPLCWNIAIILFYIDLNFCN